jgi:hypothetical protein
MILLERHYGTGAVDARIVGGAEHDVIAHDVQELGPPQVGLGCEVMGGRKGLDASTEARHKVGRALGPIN